MTPIYRSPDYNQTKAIQALLLEHKIQTSIIETKKAATANAASTVTWHELWLHKFSDSNRAKTIITQQEFTTYKTNMTSYRTATPVADTIQEHPKVKFHSTVEKIAVTNNVDYISIKKSVDPADAKAPLLAEGSEAAKPREDLIPINNKRVFKRLGLLLGYSEDQINKFENQNNKLYRPWDAGALMERVKNLKQKCS